MRTNLSNIVRAGSACPLLTAAIALALAFSLGCEEKESGKTAAAADEGLSLSVAVPASPEEQAKIAARMAEIEKASKEEAKAEAAKIIASCGKGGGSGVKLPECINEDAGLPETSKFEYDDKNRIVKMTYFCIPKGEIEINNFSTTTIIYNTDDLITVEKDNDNRKIVTKYVRKGNTITRTGNELYEPATLTIDKDGYIVKYNEKTYKYKDGNLITYNDYEFDDKKAPFSNCATPKWLLQDLIHVSSANKNNALSWHDDEVEEGMIGGKYMYEYDSNGFPTKVERDADVDAGTITTSYTYYGKENAK